MKVKTLQIMEKVVGYNLELEDLLASRASTEIEHKEGTWKQCYEIAAITSQAGRMFAKLLIGFHEELTKNHTTVKTQD